MELRPLYLLLPFFLMIQGCTPSFGLIGTEAIDPAGGMSRADYVALRDRRAPETKEADKKAESPPPIPKMPDEEVKTPPKNSPLFKRVSVAITDSVPVRDVLLELVQKAGVNLELDPRVRGNVIVTAHDQPFIEVLKRICALANLRYAIDGAFLHIGPDEPYQKSYHLDYPSLIRRASSDTTISTNVFDVDVGTGSSSNNANRSASSAENNSTSRVSGTSDADFWAEADRSIAQILGAGDKKGNAKTSFSIDKQAGILTVFASQKQQNAIEKYITELRRKISAQVLIDARIIEVELNDDFQSGIDWTGVFKNAAGVSANFGTQAALGSNGFFAAGVTGTNFSGFLNLIQTFGTTRVLSAPRVTVLNNQTAVMKVATNQVYFVTQAQFTTTTNASGASITTNPVYSSTPHTVPVGLVMTVQPSIDAERNAVTMTLRPTISRVVGNVDDPSIGLNAAVAGVTAPVESQIPILAVREMDSVVQLRSGEIAVMGGLMQDSSLNTEKGIPGFADVSWLGNMFKSRDNKSTVSELVVLLRATIADQPKPDFADEALYRQYSRDPRALIPSESATEDASITEIDAPL